MLSWHLTSLLGESPSGPSAPTLWGVDLSSTEGVLLREGLRGVAYAAIASPLLLTLVYLWTLGGARRGRSPAWPGHRIGLLMFGQGLSLFVCAFGLGFLRKYALTQSVWMLRGTALLLLLQAVGVLDWRNSSRTALPGQDAPWRPMCLLLLQGVGFHVWAWTSDYPDLVTHELFFAALFAVGALVLVWLLTAGVEAYFKLTPLRLTGPAFFLLFIPGFVLAQARLGHSLSRFEEAGQGHPFAAQVLDASQAKAFYQGKTPDVHQTLMERSGYVGSGRRSPAQYFFLPPGVGHLIASSRIPTLQAWWRELPGAPQLDLYAVAGEPGIYVTSPRPLPPMPSLKDFFTHWGMEEDLERHRFIDRYR